MLIWICGVSGSGKTTLGRLLYNHLKQSMPNLFLLDGDDFREAVGDVLGYTPEERSRNAHRIARFCHLLESQDIHVICCAVTIPPDLQALNRTACRQYYEVYMQVSLDTLIRRDPKSLYSRCLRGELRNLPGVDIEYHPPASPHLVLDNNEDLPSLDHFVGHVLDVVFASENSKRI